MRKLEDLLEGGNLSYLTDVTRFCRKHGFYLALTLATPEERGSFLLQ